MYQGTKSNASFAILLVNNNLRKKWNNDTVTFRNADGLIDPLISTSVIPAVLETSRREHEAGDTHQLCSGLSGFSFLPGTVIINACASPHHPDGSFFGQQKCSQSHPSWKQGFIAPPAYFCRSLTCSLILNMMIGIVSRVWGNICRYNLLLALL